MNAKIEPSLNFYVYAQTFNIASFIYVRKFNARTRVEITRRWKPTLTLFRLGFFGQSVRGGGRAPRTPPPPFVSLEPIILTCHAQL